MDYSPLGSSIHRIFLGKNPGVGTFLPPEDLPDPGIKTVTPMSPELLADSLPTEPSGKPQT